MIKRSDAHLVFTDLLKLGEAMGRNVILKGQDALMDSVNDPFRLGEECILQLVSGSDPVLCANNNGRCIQIVEAQLGDVGS